MEEHVNLSAFYEALSDALRQTGARIAALLPNLLVAVLIMVAGWVVARVTGWIVGRTLGRLGFDRAGERFRVGELLRQAGFTGKLSTMIGRLVYWLVLLMFLLSAAETLQLTAVRSALDRVIAFVPDLLGAALILVVGMAVAGFVRNLVVSAASAGGILQAERLGTAFRAAIILVAAILAMGEVGVDTDLLVAASTAIIMALGLSAGLAFSLGSRQVMSHVLAGHYLRRSLPAGTEVTVRKRRGRVARVGAVDTLLTDGEGSWSVPNGVLLEEEVER
jgi:hypothetical protein